MPLHDWTPERIMQKVSTGKPFTLLLLLEGKPMPADENEINKLQMGHLAHLFQMEEDGKASVFEPVLNDCNLHGMIVFYPTNKDEIEQWMATDPYIKEGPLTYKLYDFFTIPGQNISG